MKRLPYVDVFRGVAILIMIFFHFIHTLAPVNVYADFPYFLESLGIFSFPAPPFLFLFVAGMSSYLLVTKRRNEGYSRKETAKNVVRKYGRYVLISLPFAWIVFGLETWLAWEEALQGIGLSIIILALLYQFVDLDIYTGAVTMFISAVLQSQRTLIFNKLTAILPVIHNELIVGAGMLLWNAFFGGYFAVTNLLPFAIGGLLMIKLLYERETPRIALFLGAGFTVFSFLLTVAGYSLQFYARDVPLGFYGAGTAMMIYYAVYWIWEQHPDAAVFEVLSTIGKLAFLIYVWSWIAVIKVAEVVGLTGTIPHLQAYIFSFFITGGVVVSALQYARFRRINGPVMLFAWQKLINGRA